MADQDIGTLLREGALDPPLAALLWLLLEGGVPLVVAGSVEADERARLAQALLSVDPGRAWVLLDADAEAVTAERLTALLRGGTALGLTLAADRLEDVMARLRRGGLPEDGVRRLGVVVIAAATPLGLRCRVVHYLRPTERDGQGHVQRRPPAVLGAWDAETDRFEDYAWGITPELADRVDRAQADLEARQRDRARLLASVAHGDSVDGSARVALYLAGERARVPAPTRDPAAPSPFHGGLLDPH